MFKGEKLKCSFCGKSQENVKKLIAGPSVYICDECVILCNEILYEEDIDVKKSVEKALQEQKKICLICHGEFDLPVIGFYFCLKCGLEQFAKMKIKYEPLKCSFCGKEENRGAVLSKGKGVNICSECKGIRDYIVRVSDR